MKKYLSYILIIFLIITEVYLVVGKELPNDTFYSIRVGESVVKNGINSLDIDAFSWHENLKYTNPHWLNDTIIYLSFSNANYFGIYFLTIIEAVILGLIIFFVSNKYSKNKWFSCLITLFSILAIKRFLVARAQLISYILFVLEIYFLSQYIENNKKRYIVRISNHSIYTCKCSYGIISYVFCIFSSFYCK